ncbi:MFS transporter, DHA1 family, bicyclomycin/chloramphenicol resistance protein [Tranquillimonas rosea]|uniref:MFS transporter, DHA1 family, bicyclomycin/chloramphenicol resistance protein n=2 Tax=Tranquillimonas rosea TaxID=641238 RepID=A0A1H9P8M1_9RHOB|nr:MFS transporter, DHA1 family, bicyclomycin/chloramphenicol resistance protein [Tranquillimonas rosea]
MTPPKRQLKMPEFIGLMALLLATVAFSIDSMLPAMPEIAAEMSPDDPNRAQLILSAFVFGLGFGTFVAGPVSDAVGRKSAILFGLGLYLTGALLGMVADNLTFLLAARALQGFGASAPRVVGLALVRDLYGGRRMAQIMSFVMTVFLIVPAMAPSVGALIIAGFGWHGVFGAFLLLGLTSGTWLTLRQPETLAPENRRPIRAGTLWRAVREVLGHPMVRIYIAVLTLAFGQMFALLSSVQQIYDVTFDMGETFPIWFLCGGLITATGTILNGTLVMRLGMRRMAMSAYGAQIAVSGVYLVLVTQDLLPVALAFPAFFFWSTSVFFMAGLTFGNLNALALEPMGHIAGTASSVVGAVSTVMAVAIAAPIGLAFNGTSVPLAIGTLICSTIAFFLMGKSREAGPAAA